MHQFGDAADIVIAHDKPGLHRASTRNTLSKGISCLYRHLVYQTGIHIAVFHV